MDYAKGILCGFTAIVLAELVPGSWSVFRGISGTRATGLAAVAGGLVESLFSPFFGIVAIVIFALLFAASRLGNKALRILLFWIPSLTVSSVSVATVVLYTYLIIRFRNP